MFEINLELWKQISITPQKEFAVWQMSSLLGDFLNYEVVIFPWMKQVCLFLFQLSESIDAIVVGLSFYDMHICVP